jgi:DNA-binding response OmpR family regulator
VVEDEDLVRQLICLELREFGYRTLEAADLDEARKAVQSNGGVVDLLVADIVLQDTSGHCVYKALQKKHRDLKVIYVSGHTEQFIRQYGLLESGEGFLQKPFSAERLAQEIDRQLAAAPGADTVPSASEPCPGGAIESTA